MDHQFHKIRRLPSYVFAEVNIKKLHSGSTGEGMIDFAKNGYGHVCIAPFENIHRSGQVIRHIKALLCKKIPDGSLEIKL